MIWPSIDCTLAHPSVRLASAHGQPGTGQCTLGLAGEPLLRGGLATLAGGGGGAVVLEGSSTLAAAAVLTEVAAAAEAGSAAPPVVPCARVASRVERLVYVCGCSGASVTAAAEVPPAVEVGLGAVVCPKEGRTGMLAPLAVADFLPLPPIVWSLGWCFPLPLVFPFVSTKAVGP